MSPEVKSPADPPEHLSDESKRIWRQIVEENTMDGAAMPILLTYCEARDRRQQARDAIAKDGAVMLDRFGAQKISPWVSIERDSTLIMHRAFRLLGFDQEARGGAQGELFVK